MIWTIDKTMAARIDRVVKASPKAIIRIILIETIDKWIKGNDSPKKL
jgi:hypothetical protein